MTLVRDFTEGSAAIRTAIGACDVTDDQSWIAYVYFAVSANQWLIARQNGVVAGATNWMSLGYEGEKLLFYPGSKTSGSKLPLNTWLIVGGTNDASAGASHFYAYDLKENELVFAKTGATGAPAHSGTPVYLQFGRWDNTEQFNGYFAAAAVYNQGLTEAQFLELATASAVDLWLEEMAVNPVGLWYFNQTAGEEIIDQTGNGANGEVGIQDNPIATNLLLPKPIHEEEPEEPEESSNIVKVRSGGVLVDGKRYVKQGGILVPV